jgi:hypothetical protein
MNKLMKSILEPGDLLQTKQNIIITVMEVTETNISVSWYNKEKKQTVFDSYSRQTIENILNNPHINPWVHHKS